MTVKTFSAGDFVNSVCKKCKKTTKHIIVGLVDGVPAKVQCTDCKSNHNYRKEAAPGEKSKQKPAPSRQVSQDWIAMSEKWDETKATPYAIGGVFKKGELLNHAHFGLGVILGAPAEKKMRVLFREGEKLLLCGN